MDPLELTLDEWQTLRNAIMWHKQDAVIDEKERIDKISAWVEEAFHNMSVNTIRLEVVIDPELEDFRNNHGQGPFLED